MQVKERWQTEFENRQESRRLGNNFKNMVDVIRTGEEGKGY